MTTMTPEPASPATKASETIELVGGPGCGEKRKAIAGTPHYVFIHSSPDMPAPTEYTYVRRGKGTIFDYKTEGIKKPKPQGAKA